MLCKVAGEYDSYAVGLLLLVNCISALACLALYWCRGVLHWPNSRDLKYFFIWVVLYSVLNQVMIYCLSSQLDAALVSIFTVLEGLIIIAAAAALSLQRASLRRCAGLLTGRQIGSAMAC